MHLIADAADIEDHVVLTVRVDQAFEFADHGCEPAMLELPSPLRGRVGGGGPHEQWDLGLPPSPTLPRRKSGWPDLRESKMCNRGKPRLRGGGSEGAWRPDSPPPCGEGSGVGTPST